MTEQLIYGSPEFAANYGAQIMPSPSAGEMKVTWNYGHRGGLSDDSIEFWIGEERIARFAGTKEAMDHLALTLRELRTQRKKIEELYARFDRRSHAEKQADGGW